MPTEAPIFHTPYGDPAKDHLYNLLFCDNPELFRPKKAGAAAPHPVIAAKRPSTEVLQRIAGDVTEESRYRVLAYNRLRASDVEVPAKVLLGTIVEVPMEHGLDTLAAFADGRVRYINQAGGIAVFEGSPPHVKAQAEELVRLSQRIVDRIGPWEKERLPAPKGDAMRLTFLCSDGLYFGQGPYAALARDGMAGPVVAAATQLLRLVVDTALDNRSKKKGA
jgi:hypothetical protein